MKKTSFNKIIKCTAIVLLFSMLFLPTAYAQKSIRIEPTENRDYFLADEIVSYDITAVGYGEENQLEYLITYSTNGKSYKKANRSDDWQDFVPQADNVMTVVDCFPNMTKDSKYYVKVQVRASTSTKVYQEDITIVNSYTHMPQDSVDIDVSEIKSVVPDEGVLLSATAKAKPGYKPKANDPVAEYQFFYRIQGSSRWKAINKTYTTTGQTRFIPKSEGTYFFKVAAKTKGRRDIDVENTSYEAKALYFSTPPVRTIYNLKTDKKEYTYDEQIKLTMDIDTDDTENVLYQVLYSTNGIFYKTFSGATYTELKIVDGSATVVVPKLPAKRKDTTYYLKVEVKSEGRTSENADVFAVTQVKFIYMPPIENVTPDIARDEGHLEFVEKEKDIDILQETKEELSGDIGSLDYAIGYALDGRNIETIEVVNLSNEQLIALLQTENAQKVVAKTSENGYGIITSYKKSEDTAELLVQTQDGITTVFLTDVISAWYYMDKPKEIIEEKTIEQNYGMDIPIEELTTILEAKDAQQVMVETNQHEQGVVVSFSKNNEIIELVVDIQGETKTIACSNIVRAWRREQAEAKVAEEDEVKQDKDIKMSLEELVSFLEEKEEPEVILEIDDEIIKVALNEDKKQEEVVEQEEPIESKVPKVIEIDGIKFYTQQLKESAGEKEYPIKIDGYTAGLAMMIEYFASVDIEPKDILAVEDIHKIGTESVKIEKGLVDYIIEKRGVIEDYYGLKANEIFKGYDIQQLRRRIRSFKYGESSPVMVYFEIDKWTPNCSFILDYDLDADGLLDTNTYKYIPTYTAYRHTVDENGTYISMQAMVAVDYERDKSGNVVSLTVLNPYSEFGQGAVITADGMTLTNGDVIPEINLGEIQGYMFLSQVKDKGVFKAKKNTTNDSSEENGTSKDTDE